jgi:alkylated DNA repair dioxygenase AlkB
VIVFGKSYDQPRLTALYSQTKKTYSYSGLTMAPEEFPEYLKGIKKKVELVSKQGFNTLLVNLYRDGKDSNGWHADNEKELGSNPIIASISLGEERPFHFKHRTLKDERHKLLLKNGSLLIMRGEMQHYWLHQIAKTKKKIGPRINLTFRTLKN